MGVRRVRPIHCPQEVLLSQQRILGLSLQKRTIFYLFLFHNWKRHVEGCAFSALTSLSYTTSSSLFCLVFVYFHIFMGFLINFINFIFQETFRCCNLYLEIPCKRFIFISPKK